MKKKLNETLGENVCKIMEKIDKMTTLKYKIIYYLPSRYHSISQSLCCYDLNINCLRQVNLGNNKLYNL